MKKRILGLGTLALMAALVVGLVGALSFPADAEAFGGRAGRQGGIGGQGSGQAGNLTPIDGTYVPTAEEVEALNQALDDEYKAWSVYEQVIEDFGAVRPFTSIQRAEESHIDALMRLFEAYELEAPENAWVGNVPSFDSLADACAAGVQAEIDNADLYDELFAATENADIIRVFTALQQASLTKHLPAFERCAG